MGSGIELCQFLGIFLLIFIRLVVGSTSDGEIMSSKLSFLNIFESKIEFKSNQLDQIQTL